MATLMFTLLCGVFTLSCIAMFAAIYIAVGALVASRFDGWGFSYWKSVAAGITTPLVVIFVIYLLGNYTMGVLLSGGFH